MRVTIKQIAEMANTSSAAVSLVLNGKHENRISPENARKIREIAGMLNYQPNLKARALVQGRTGNIAVLVNEIGNPFYVQYITILQRLLEPRGYTVFPFETQVDPMRERKFLNWTEQGYFDGCICLEYNWFNREAYVSNQRVPVVCRGWSGAAPDSDQLIGVNYHKAIRQLCGHLAEQGWRKLAVTIDSQDYEDGHEKLSVRKAFYLECCSNLPLTLRNDCWISVPREGEERLKVVKEKTVELLNRRPEIDAILVASAQDVPGVYKALSELRRRVGRDIAVAAFDHIPLLSYLCPEVTHISEPSEMIAAALVEELLQKIGGDTEIRTLKFDAMLMIQKSSIKEVIKQKELVS